MSYNQSFSPISNLEHLPKKIEPSYQPWIHSFIEYHEGTHPILLGSNELKSYILYLDFKLHLPKASIVQAFKALEFLYTKIFQTSMPQYEELSNR